MEKSSCLLAGVSVSLVCSLVNYINAMTFQRANGVENIALVFFCFYFLSFNV